MSEQQSQKRGVRSDAQKTATPRTDYDPIPPANPVGGAFGEQQKRGQSDQDLAESKLAASNEEKQSRSRNANNNLE